MKTPETDRDMSNGWEAIAGSFIANRSSEIGVATVTAWSKTLKPGAAILDLGCGFGVPFAELLINSGFHVHGIDASPTLVNEFRRRFPQASTVCESVETSNFFGRKFDAIIAIGLIFLLSESAQLELLRKVAAALNSGGRFLFTSPYQVCSWNDLQTGRKSRSLGRETFVGTLARLGLSLHDEYSDEGENHYFDFSKP